MPKFFWRKTFDGTPYLLTKKHLTPLLICWSGVHCPAGTRVSPKIIPDIRCRRHQIFSMNWTILWNCFLALFCESLFRCRINIDKMRRRRRLTERIKNVDRQSFAFGSETQAPEIYGCNVIVFRENISSTFFCPLFWGKVLNSVRASGNENCFHQNI